MVLYIYGGVLCLAIYIFIRHCIYMESDLALSKFQWWKDHALCVTQTSEGLKNGLHISISLPRVSPFHLVSGIKAEEVYLEQSVVSSLCVV